MRNVIEKFSLVHISRGTQIRSVIGRYVSNRGKMAAPGRNKSLHNFSAHYASYVPKLTSILHNNAANNHSKVRNAKIVPFIA